MAYFFCKLIPPRPTFAQDMSETERKLMQAHATYWREALDQRSVIVFGPVGDPGGVWGMGVLQVESPEAAADFGASDPAVKAGVGFRFEFYPMPLAIYK